MPQPLSDTINLIASAVTIMGGVLSIGGAINKWRVKPNATTPPGRPSKRTSPPRASTFGPIQQPTTRQTAQSARRGANHPIILSYSTLGLLAVVTYSVEMLINYMQSGGVSTGVPPDGPLIGVNAVLIALNLGCVTVVTVGMAITAYRAQSRIWLLTGVIALIVSLCTIGVFSAVALVPGVFYGLSGPRDSDMWGS